MGGLGALFKGFSTVGSENVLLVRDYLLSRELILELDNKLGLREAYGEGDVLSRFPAIWNRDSFEEFFDYYPHQVRIVVDPLSSVGVLTVRGYTPEMVHSLNKTLIQSATDRINELNSQIRADALGIAERELERAQQRLAAAEQTLAEQRVEMGVVDPEQQAGLELKSEQELRGALAIAKSHLSQVTAVAPQSPQIPALQAEVASLTASVAAITRGVSGSEEGSRAEMTQEFSALLVEREIAAKTVAAANEALIRARVEAERRHLYLETVSAPTLPDDALLPERAKNIGATFLLGLLLYFVLSMTRLGVREHKGAI
jgi:capsular polysaccharide transport system permease protein